MQQWVERLQQAEGLAWGKAGQPLALWAGPWDGGLIFLWKPSDLSVCLCLSEPRLRSFPIPCGPNPGVP